ncbi:MAG: M48 family metallopeptidase [Devosia sp.]
MQGFEARFHDGVTARVESVCLVPPLGGQGAIEILASDGTSRDRWPVETLYTVPTRKGTVRLGSTARPAGARLEVTGKAEVQRLLDLLPGIGHKRTADRRRQLGVIGLATAALGSLIIAYVVGVPLLARNIVGLVPAAWEESLGATVAAQIEQALSQGAGFAVCDPDPQSLANRAIARFAQSVAAGTGTPFSPRITVIRSEIPNAFALPGGQAYYFSALLDRTSSADEFAGVLAHELGHVVYRHGLEGLISTSATGLLIGFILGDLTGLSVAGGLGSALIDTRFSREAEREADRFALDAARRLGFRPAGLADLLDRISEDDRMSRALALLSTHPLSEERRAALEDMEGGGETLSPAFTPIEWQAIKSMCAEAEGPWSSVSIGERPGSQSRQRDLVPLETVP